MSQRKTYAQEHNHATKICALSQCLGDALNIYLLVYSKPFFVKKIPVTVFLIGTRSRIKAHGYQRKGQTLGYFRINRSFGI